MKKILFAIIVAVAPIMMSAQSYGVFSRRPVKQAVDMSMYTQAGAVPEVDGKVVFTETIDAQGKSQEELYKRLSSWANLRFMPNTENGEWYEPSYYKNFEYSTIKTADKDGLIVCMADEEQVFSNKTLSKDFTRMNYTLSMQFGNGKVIATISNISYVYTATGNASRIPAEDWITDKEALSKKGGLMRIPGRFRVKTIDLKNELFAQITKVVTE